VDELQSVMKEFQLGDKMNTEDFLKAVDKDNDGRVAVADTRPQFSST